MTRFTLAANNGEIGGGEVMLLRTAKVLRQLGHEVTVVAPAIADGVGAAAAKAGFATVAIKGQGRKAYMRNLRAWDANWCEEVKTEPKGDLKAPITVGFLGRPSPDKGIEVLAEAMAQLNATRGNAFELVVAGEPRFVDAA